MKFALTLAISLIIPAASTQAEEEPRELILFGAQYSNKFVMQRCYPGVRVVPFTEGEATWKKIVEEMRANPQKKYTIAGHSTASVYAEHVGRKTPYPNNLKIVLLDGYGDTGVQDRVETHCWNAVGPNGLKSYNHYSTSKANCNKSKSITHTLKNPHCQTEWCLHFSLVNLNAAPELRARGEGPTWGRNGYDSCKPFLDWTTLK